MELDHILRETSSTKPQRCHESHGTKILIFHTAGSSSRRRLWAVWLDWANYFTLGNCLQSVATIFLTKLPTFLGNFFKGVEIFPFSSEIIFWQLWQTFGNFYWSHMSFGLSICFHAVYLSLSPPRLAWEDCNVVQLVRLLLWRGARKEARRNNKRRKIC